MIDLNTFAALALALAIATPAAAQGAPIPSDSSWEQVHWTKIHGWCMATGFFILLPLGSLTARYLRAYLPFQKWLGPHAAIQLIALPVICIGFGVGVHVAIYNGQWKVPHTKIGLTLFLMYWIQLVLGICTASTPSVALGNAKPDPTAAPDARHPLKARPWYALLHAFWGVSMCIMASVQVRRGYTIEWPMKRGQPASEHVNRAWKAWVVIVPVLYLGGLALLLRRQWSQERARMLNPGAAPANHENEAQTSPDPQELPPPIQPPKSYIPKSIGLTQPHDPSVPPKSLLKPPVHAPTHHHPVALLHFRTYYHPNLEFFLHFAYHAAYALGIPLSHPAHLPTQRSLFTVLKSPFIFKKAQENFEKKTHKRAVKVWDTEPEVLNVWLRYLEEHMMPGVG
ncbi:30S ribosomal protein S10, mitochondrial AltName: Full=Mitochondrial ribosomal small subunit protein 10 [Rhizoctonia solani AG-1 IB]|uniref:RSM10 protein n=1 Tax=Thanatephorus cucumeris (strain AG1-IB / isolate 7/3/14) TaxID=1108050 RepID=M5BSW0_THACB|nr:30S ribosomal protein S10, mitochondrial AltName: Full=Mitochondrial ribosomal small subunit protein 10 [Rhizoctonia solani AG-1 IB]